MDAAFKQIITAGWNVKSGGDVESPQGFFAVIEIPAHKGELADMIDAVELSDEDVATLPQAGWYFTVENEHGQIVTSFLGEGEDGREASLSNFARLEVSYNDWVNSTQF